MRLSLKGLFYFFDILNVIGNDKAISVNTFFSTTGKLHDSQTSSIRTFILSVYYTIYLMVNFYLYYLSWWNKDHNFYGVSVNETRVPFNIYRPLWRVFICSKMLANAC